MALVSDDKDLTEVIGELYEAATDFRKWQPFMASLARRFDGTMAQVSNFDLGDKRFSMVLFHGMDHVPTEVMQRYPEMVPYDPRQHVLMARHGDRPFADAVHCRMLVDDRTLHDSRFYREILGPGGLEFLVAGLVRTGNELSSISAARGPDALPFTDVDVANMRRLLPHIQRAFQIQKQLALMDMAVRQSTDALDAMPGAVAVVDARLKLTFGNRAAQNLLEAGKGLGMRAGRLQVRDASAAAALQQAIASTIAQARGSIATSARFVRIPHADSNGFDAVQVMALWENRVRFGMPLLAEPLAVLMISDPSEPVMPSTEALRRFFMLTPAEAELVACLAVGMTLEAASLRLGRGLGTCRTQLKSVFGKTGTTRQAELVRLVLGTPAWCG